MLGSLLFIYQKTVNLKEKSTFIKFCIKLGKIVAKPCEMLEFAFTEETT
jgi:hypothetical protein